MSYEGYNHMISFDKKKYSNSKFSWVDSLFSGERIRVWINTTLMFSKFFLLPFIWIYERWKHNLDDSVIAAFLKNFQNSEGLNLQFLLRFGFDYMTQHLRRTETYYKMPNMKRDCTRRNTSCKRQRGGKQQRIQS